MRSRLLAFARLCAVALFAAVVLLAPRPARAGGTVSVTDLQPKEEDGRWKLKMTMNYGGVPATAHVPMLFTFTLTVLYERTLLDKTGDKPQLTKQSMANQPPINESMDVGFSDASGKLFNITKFDFVIRRDHGFEAGEYSLKITRSNDGVQMGQPMRLILQGDNVIVDRRAMVFSGEKKPKKADAADGEKKDPPSNDAASPEPPAGEGPNDGPPVETPPPVTPKQGGCGCRVAEAADPTGAFALALMGLAAITLRRSRRRSRRR
jgi:MYXO-CTERM domain-containing protein